MKNNYKLIIGIIIGLTISITGAWAATTIITGSDVIYDNSSSGGSSNNVQGAIDELYQKAKTLSGDLGKKYTEDILNGADPVLGKDMIPVKIADDGTVKYANVNSEWYSYKHKEWANAVILVKSPTKDYKVNDTILEKDIESYFVWIPRYRYKIWNLGTYTSVPALSSLKDDGLTSDVSVRRLFGNARIIDVVFESTSETPQNGNAVGAYLTHPAFQLGTTKLNGIWVGKFETGYNQMDATGTPITTSGWNTGGAQKDVVASGRIIVKPNVYSWRNITVAKIFENAMNYASDLKSHMMKNTEWGAVAYLSHSAYGKGSEININNNSSYLTGYSAAPNTDQSTYPGQYGTADSITQKYNTATGYLASTTGNISGVYDMSGGAHEYMASYMDGYVGASGFTLSTVQNWVTQGYIDKYPSNSNTTTYNNRILGDATGEMGPFFNYKDGDGSNRYHNTWYADGSYFVLSTYPWFGRGGGHYYGVLAGQFNFSRNTGGVYTYFGSRLVLAIP